MKIHYNFWLSLLICIIIAYNFYPELGHLCLIFPIFYMLGLLTYDYIWSKFNNKGIWFIQDKKDVEEDE